MGEADVDVMTAFLQQVDWHRPWLAPVRLRAEQILASGNWRQALNAAAMAMNLRNFRGLPIQFVPQSALPSGTAYEAFIGETGAVPTRTNLHDFFNALVWLTFPRTKVQLNCLQAAEIANLAASGQSRSDQRGKLRDGATIFDENAAFFVTALPSMAANLRAHAWDVLFLEQRAVFQTQAEVCLFGHALMEKLVNPYKAITAHAWTVIVDQDFFLKSPDARYALIDEIIAAQIANGLATSDFSHLPILGVPDWWQSQDRAFYADTSVFRPKRTQLRG